MAMRGLSSDSGTFLPRLKNLNEGACEMSPWQACEIHMDNARPRMRSNDFNPADRTHSKASLLEKALSVLEAAGGRPRNTRLHTRSVEARVGPLF